MYEALYDAKTKLFSYQQKEDETLADHVQNVNDLINTVVTYFIVIDNNKAMSLLKKTCHKRYRCSYSRSEISSLSK